MGQLAIVLSVFLTIACTRDHRDKQVTPVDRESVDKNPKPVPKARKAPMTAVWVSAFADAQLQIERLRRAQKVDWQEIGVQIKKGMPVVEFVDREFGTQYRQEIVQGLEECKAQREVAVNQQVVAKGLQHVAVMGIDWAFDQINGGLKETPADGVLMISEFARGIMPTLERRDTDFFGGKKTLVGTALHVLDEIKQAGAANDRVRMMAARRTFDDVVFRTYALSVAFEISQIETLRKTEPDKCAVKRKEAEIFYRIIRQRIAKADIVVDQIIVSMLSGDFDKMNLNLFYALLKRGLPSVAVI